jgi:short-subunit dehydrogenase
VSVLSPGMTETEGLRTIPNIDFSKMKGVTILSAVEVAKAGLDGLGKEVNIVPGAKNKFSVFLFRFFPPTVLTKMVAKMTRDAVDKEAQ